MVKTALFSKGLSVGSNHPDVSLEAAIMVQLNEANCDSILFLRNFKYYKAQMECRYFFEYCPYGDLERIRFKYLSWYEYLPEAFLWWVFLRLIDSLQVLEEGPLKKPFYKIGRLGYGDKTPIPDSFCLHNDIKPQNSKWKPVSWSA